MKLFQKLLLAPAALGLLAPVAANAADVNIAGLSQYGTEEQVTSITQFSDVQPTDWAYQALSNLIERYGCVAGYPNGTYRGNRAMTRYEAAALLNACLDRITEVTDELKRLMKEFERELAVLRGRVDGLEARVGELEATQFSTTTKLRGQATFVLGGNSFSGTSSQNSALPFNANYNKANYGATVFNYDVRLNFDTSFTGKDLLRTTLRADNFYGQNGVGASPYSAGLTFLEVATNAPTQNNVVEVNRLFYNFPLGKSFSVNVGARVRMDDAGMLGHQVPHLPLQAARSLGAVVLKHPVQFIPGLLKSLSAAVDVGAFGHVIRPVLAHNPPVNHQLNEGVSAQAVGAVQTAGCLADRVKPVHAGTVIIRAHPDAAHGIVRGRGNFHRLFSNVQHLQVNQSPVNAGQLVEDDFPRQMRNVQIHATVFGAATLSDFGVVGQRHAVTGGELTALRIVLLHESLTQRVAQDAALATRCFGD